MRRAALTATSACAGALALLVAGAPFTLGPLALARLSVLGGALGALALFDVRERRIPNKVVLPAAALCAALTLAEGVHQSAGLYVGVLLVAVLLATSLAAPATLGMGDVKLALLMVCALGALSTLALFTALELYALVAVALLVHRGRSALGASLPLAPILAASCLIAVAL